MSGINTSTVGHRTHTFQRSLQTSSHVLFGHLIEDTLMVAFTLAVGGGVAGKSSCSVTLLECSR